MRSHELGLPSRALGSPKGVQERTARRRACTRGLRSEGREERGTQQGLSPPSHAQLAGRHPGFR